MTVLHRFRRYTGTLSRASLALFALVWLSIAIAPCLMAMQADMSAAGQECPNCPPRPCHEVTPEDCDAPDSLDALRLAEKAQSIAFLPPRTFEPVFLISTAHVQTAPVFLPPVRAGPRVHLVHVQFNE
ncbi:MAG: hypothetical protein RQ826_03785 [Xanthomonadales bacterium]|nr:hypothetical protein [Xanthomonadales bacterium]